MRKLIVTENLSLDGVMEATEKWSGPYENDEMVKRNKVGMSASDALLLGRVTYEIFAAYWPHQTNDKTGIADYLNKTSKFVVSSSLKKADWVNTTILGGDAVEQITKLKQQPGKNITVNGSATLVQTLMKADLIDEYSLLVFPIILGKGKRLFPDGMDSSLKLIESNAFSSGVVALTYQPVKK